MMRHWPRRRASRRNDGGHDACETKGGTDAFPERDPEPEAEAGFYSFRTPLGAEPCRTARLRADGCRPRRNVDHFARAIGGAGGGLLHVGSGSSPGCPKHLGSRGPRWHELPARNQAGRVVPLRHQHREGAAQPPACSGSSTQWTSPPSPNTRVANRHTRAIIIKIEGTKWYSRRIVNLRTGQMLLAVKDGGVDANIAVAGSVERLQRSFADFRANRCSGGAL